jgi:hypothetical protein
LSAILRSRSHVRIVLGRPKARLVGPDLGRPPRQNSCRPDMISNLGAIRMKYGSVRRIIQEQSGGAVVAAGERQCWLGVKRDRRFGANIGAVGCASAHNPIRSLLVRSSAAAQFKTAEPGFGVLPKSDRSMRKFAPPILTNVNRLS